MGTGSIAIDDFTDVPPAIVFSSTESVNSTFSAVAGHQYTLIANEPATMSFG